MYGLADASATRVHFQESRSLIQHSASAEGTLDSSQPSVMEDPVSMITSYLSQCCLRYINDTLLHSLALSSTTKLTYKTLLHTIPGPKMISNFQSALDKSHVTPYQMISPVEQKHPEVGAQEMTLTHGNSTQGSLWDSKEPPVALREKLRFLWWSILLILSQIWRDALDLHNGFASLFLADLLSHFFVSRLKD
jgi:hypothetical protein